jgi:hypothetical protein
MAAFVIFSCGTAVKKSGATAEIVQGSVAVAKGDVSLALVTGAKIDEGSIVKTGPDGIAVISLNDGSAKFEVQQNSEFDLQKISFGIKNFSVRKGNVWNWVRKLKKRQAFTVDAPTAVVGVRGTKFYIFKIGDMEGICHCEGSVATTDKSTGTEGTDSQDTLSFSRNGKTILLTAADLSGIGFHHNHSALSNSPVGAKSTPDPVVMGKIMAIVAQKFKNPR